MSRILIIKIGADGDVIRTLPIARVLKEKNPDSEITWITNGVAELLEGNPYIDYIGKIPCDINGKFDKLYNFDLEFEASEIALKTEAKEKYGFFVQDNYPAAFNLGAEYYLSTVFDDDLKKNNRKTYQEMIFDAAELQYNHEKCLIYLNENDIKYSEDFAKTHYLDQQRLIGIHMGASSRWPSKVWSEDQLKEFIRLLKREGYSVLLFGGPNEAERFDAMTRKLENELIQVYRNDPYNTKKQFAALVSLCEIMVCSDSFSLHVSLALEKPTIGLFFCTSPWEVEGYNLLTKVVSPMLPQFFPERMNEYNEELVNSIKAKEVFQLLKNIQEHKK